MNKHGKCMKPKIQKKKKQKQQRERKKKLELARAQVGGNHQVLVYYDKFPILPDVPEGIVCDIMSRLPVKSLMTFKCVRKRWQSLIQKDDFFTDLHYSRLKTAGRVSLVRIGELKLKGMLNDMKCVISMELPLPSEIVIGCAADCGAMSLWKYPFPKENCAFCTTNGLLCVMDLVDYCACVYNISTRESTPWIKSTLIKQQEDKKQELHTAFSLTRFGLGYDPVTKEHKVIALWNGIGTNELVCEVKGTQSDCIVERYWI
ncbi:hypothetical protein MKX03_021314 [Papaver bracteatum]|nr:hypothetical protein MKX03_021314 [Papaver bracteatum]